MGTNPTKKKGNKTAVEFILQEQYWMRLHLFRCHQAQLPVLCWCCSGEHSPDSAQTAQHSRFQAKQLWFICFPPVSGALAYSTANQHQASRKRAALCHLARLVLDSHRRLFAYGVLCGPIALGLPLWKFPLKSESLTQAGNSFEI